MTHTAVILAARKEMDSEIPYPLLPADGDLGETIIDRSIRILRKHGVSNIIIIVGFRKELFGRFAEEEGITLAYNPDYTFTSSMASLATAEPYIKEDFILLESDIVFEEKVIDELLSSRSPNCLTIASQSGNGDEAFVESDNGCIIKISKDIHQLNRIDGEMVGISKISLDTLRMMMIKWSKNKNLKLNYEYLFLDCTEKHERHFIRPTELLWCEVDNAKDYRNLTEQLYRKLRRKENPFDYQNIISHLHNALGNTFDENKLKVEYIGGMTNRNFKVTSGEDQFVLRVPGNGTEGMIERCNETANTLISNRLGISPDTLYINEDTGIKLTRFIPGAETLNSTTIQRYEHLTQITDIFKRLHNSRVRLNNEFNVFHEIQKYENLMKRAGACMYDGYDLIRPEVMALRDTLNSLRGGGDMKPCHNDLVPENFIKDEYGKIYLIDWEYSGMNDPMWDFAALFIESDFSEDNINLVLSRYLGQSPDPIIRLRIKIYQILMDILWSIWTVTKEAKGDDFGDYGHMRFQRAIKQLNEIKH